MEIIIAIFSLILGGVVSYFIFMPVRRRTLITNQQVEELENQVKNLTSEKINIEDSLSLLYEKENYISESVDKQQKLADEQLKALNEKFELAAEKLSSQYEEAEKQYEQEYLNEIAAFIEKFNLTVNEKNQELATIVKQLNNAQAKQAAVVEAFKREEQKVNESNFYRLQLSDEDIQEVEKLEEIAVYFRNSEPLYKIIWKTYYEKAFTDLIGRIVSSDNMCGIYKITNLKNQKSYVGQSVNIKDRLRNHIKKGLGADASGRNKLYAAMRRDKVENFSYEVIELCSRDQLNDRECFWIDYYKTQEYGYNETKGGS